MNETTIDIAVTPQNCTECGVEIPDGTFGVYIQGYGYGSRMYELVLCGDCADGMYRALGDLIENQEGEAE